MPESVQQMAVRAHLNRIIEPEVKLLRGLGVPIVLINRALESMKFTTPEDEDAS
jgi:hypothetical protein